MKKCKRHSLEKNETCKYGSGIGKMKQIFEKSLRKSLSQISRRQIRSWLYQLRLEMPLRLQFK